MKPRTPIRRTAIRRKPRKPSEYARIYGSRTRALFVKSLPCQMCFRVGPSDNAHVGREGKGMGRKANYDQIAALCRRCHTDYDNGDMIYDRGTDSGKWNRMLVLCAADRTEKLWQSHTNGDPE